jgi:hypothetical protein
MALDASLNIRDNYVLKAASGAIKLFDDPVRIVPDFAAGHAARWLERMRIGITNTQKRQWQGRRHLAKNG